MGKLLACGVSGGVKSCSWCQPVQGAFRALRMEAVLMQPGVTGRSAVSICVWPAGGRYCIQWVRKSQVIGVGQQGQISATACSCSTGESRKKKGVFTVDFLRKKPYSARTNIAGRCKPLSGGFVLPSELGSRRQPLVANLQASCTAAFMIY